MKQQWQIYSDKFLLMTQREQYMILLTGLIVAIMLIFNMIVDGNLSKIAQLDKNISKTTQSNRSRKITIEAIQERLSQDPNISLRKQITQYEKRLMAFDTQLMSLTSDLINPIQMRHALIELLKIEKGVSLVSFEVIEAEPLLLPKMVTKEEQEEKEKVIIKPTTSEQAFGLYRHGIKLTLRGNYFQLRNYLLQLEGLSWTFFWQQFNYQLLEHPKSELEIEIYSLSTKREFIGV